jgi:hypothetical protein
MYLKNLIFIFVIVLGMILFLYGSAIYVALIGWIGVYFIIGGILLFLVLYLYNGLFTKKQD